ncbi:UNVERIFIED_CONTAM: hypothetical protein GTU68_010387 [Idotea baltica]|nr:hypothetical protein [Idotea baltica]
MIVPVDKIEAAILKSLIEDFVSREGTDYGEVEVSIEMKVEQVMKQLKEQTAVVTFNPEDETFAIVNSSSVA